MRSDDYRNTCIICEESWQGSKDGERCPRCGCEHYESNGGGFRITVYDGHAIIDVILEESKRGNPFAQGARERLCSFPSPSIWGRRTCGPSRSSEVVGRCDNCKRDADALFMVSYHFDSRLPPERWLVCEPCKTRRLRAEREAE